MTYEHDAVVVGSGPNGLSAAVTLAQAGWSVLLVEARDRIGGAMRSGELTLPGFLHDLCSSVHPMGELSPFMRRLPLAQHGLEFIHPRFSAAHPLDGGRVALLERSVERTSERLGLDGPAYRSLLAPLMAAPEILLEDLLGPLGRIPKRPVPFVRFGLRGMRSAVGLARGLFRQPEARALFAGCAAHSIIPLESFFSAAVGLTFLVTGHMTDWPVVRGGSEAIARALGGYFESLGGKVRTSFEVARLDQLPSARAYLFDLAPKQVVNIAGDALPAGYRSRLLRYRYGPGVFKLHYALSEPIPWRSTHCRQASTVHVGGTLEEIARSERAAFHGELCDRPFVMVSQQSQFDRRAPHGKHVGDMYCHVPFGSTADRTEAIERQIERFAPGFRDCVIERRRVFPADLERDNPAHLGGVIAGGAADLTQLFTRPVARLDPYTTPNPRLFLCGASTPPGGGVHGLCGYYAAKSVLSRH